MKRKARSNNVNDGLKTSEGKQPKQALAGVDIRNNAEAGSWHVSVSQQAEVFCCGCFRLTIESGTLNCRGAALTSADGQVSIASYSGTTAFRLQVQIRSEGVPLVLAKVASSTFTLHAVSPGCSVVVNVSDLPSGIVPEASESLDKWDEALESVMSYAQNLPVVLVCGPKKAGKSSLARRVVNNLLAHHDSVTLLEADCGQPHFGPPGFVSSTEVMEPLLLPSNCLLRQPDEMMCIGDVSAESNPILFINSIRKLLEGHYGTDPSGALRPSSPLVINTMGWVKGFGLSLLRDVIHAARPSHVLSLCSGNPRKDVSASEPWMQEACQLHNIHCMELPCIIKHGTHASDAHGGAAPPKPQAHSATDDRNSRLHVWMLATLQTRQPQIHSEEALLATAFAGRVADTAAKLCACPPVVLPLEHVQVLPLFEGWSEPNTAAVLNGALVALVAEGELPPSVTDSNTFQESMVSNPPRCCGLGLIHAVAPSDHESTGRAQNFHESSAVTDAGVAYIHTPVSLQTMQTVVAVVVGMLEVPAAVMRAPGMCSPYVEFRCLASDVGGGGVMKSRRSLQRVGQAS